MSGVYLTRHGGPDALEWRDDIVVPTPRVGQVLVRVLAAGVNNTDINTRIGWYSSDVAGATEDVGGNADVVEDGVSGAVIPSDDVSAIASAIKEFMVDPNRSKKMGSSAKGLVAAKHSVSAMTARYEDLYRELRRPRISKTVENRKS